jgi:spermidine synthase
MPNDADSHLPELMTAEIVTHSRVSAYHTIRVVDIGQRRILQFERTRQSSMYLDNPFETDFEYPAFFHIGLAIRPEAERTLVIGLGGGTAVKRMWRDYPEMHVDAVELDPDVVEIAREYFALPDDPRIRVIIDDGRHHIETAPDIYDIVVVDAFDDDRIPLPLTTEEFLWAVRARLTEDGVVTYNVIGSLLGDHSKAFRSLHRTLRNTFRRVWVFNADEGVEAKGNNLVLLASDTKLSTAELLERIANRVDGRVSLPAFDQFGQNLYEGPIRTGDVPILSDPPGNKRG